MSTLHAQAAVMEQVATRFDDVHRSLTAMLSGLRREVESVRTGWQGRGGASFERVSLVWAEEQERLVRALAETATAVRTAGRVYSTTDDQAADRMRSLPL